MDLSVNSFNIAYCNVGQYTGSGFARGLRAEMSKRRSKHGRKAKRGQPLGGRGGRAYKAR